MERILNESGADRVTNEGGQMMISGHWAVRSEWRMSKIKDTWVQDLGAQEHARTSRDK